MNELDCYLSYDPAIDMEAMGDDYNKHYGKLGGTYLERFGTRDPKLIKLIPGVRATKFVIKALSMRDFRQCDALMTNEQRWERAFALGIISIEMAKPLATVDEVVFGRHNQMLSDDEIDYIMNRVGKHAIYEIGAVVYNRSKLSPLTDPYAPLLDISLHEQIKLLESRAAIQKQKISETNITLKVSDSPLPIQQMPVEPGVVPAIENLSSPSVPVNKPVSVESSKVFKKPSLKTRE